MNYIEPLVRGTQFGVTNCLRLLTKTAIPESGRVMIYGDLAGLYSHHLNMFELHTQQEPFWDIVQMATFVLDIADEEIFNKLCASAKAGQALRLSRDQI